jgi:hypothetical protein
MGRKFRQLFHVAVGVEQIARVRHGQVVVLELRRLCSEHGLLGDLLQAFVDGGATSGLSISREEWARAAFTDLLPDALCGEFLRPLPF